MFSASINVRFVPKTDIDPVLDGDAPAGPIIGSEA